MIKRFSSVARWTICGMVLAFGAIRASADTDTNAAVASTNAPAATTNAAPAAAAAAPAAAPAPPAATLTQRVADLESYVNNGSSGPGSDGATPTPVKWTSLLTGSGPGHNAWMMVSTAFVLMMTLPGLALFYGGLVRRKNVLSVIAQCFGITGLVTILWYFVGYSLVFGNNNGAYWANAGYSPLGDLQFFMLKGVNSTPNGNYGYWVGQNVYAMFQMTFAIITPALIVGGIAERMKFSALMIFIGCWMFIVYFPLAHCVWGIDGIFNGVWNPKAPVKAMDFAGGTVVHMSSGYSGLILALILGKRAGWGKTSFAPHSTVLTFIGAALLWVGWYGFNAGSAVAADVVSSNAFTTTTLATAVASFVWPTMEFFLKGKATVVGFCSGAVAGLVVITPACGYVTPDGGMIIGVIAGTIPFLTTTYLKPLLGYDDALDVFGVHAIGGTCGALATGFLANATINSNLGPGGAGGQVMADLCDFSKGHHLYIEQLKVILFTILLSCIGTAVIAFILKAVMGLRPTPEQEEAGLDVSDHGEEGYIL
jgi:Amt family ammonium transporter